ncbi:MAG: hypothetical protein NVSMB27_29250 [Ktedonobacteraceae bacterium]
MAQRGIVVTYANELCHRRPTCGDTWHLDEVVLTIRGKKHSLWRAVDQHGNVLDILVQSRRNKQAAKKFFRKLLKGLEYRATLQCRFQAWNEVTGVKRVRIRVSLLISPVALQYLSFL